jgi:serine/threonine protein kinase
MAPHNNVVAVRGIVSEESPPFFGLVLEFVARGSMKDVYKELQLPLRTNVKVIYGIGLGIAYIHTQSVEHRDLWPANVLLDRDFTPKLADFGLAITRGTRKAPNKCQFRWSSPERCQNHIKRVSRFDPKNDVWSFGMIAYWALTDEKPFPDVEKGNQVRYRLERGERPAFSTSTHPNVPKPLVDAVLACWRFGSRERPAMHEVCAMLADVLVDDGKRLGNDLPETHKADTNAWCALTKPAQSDESPTSERTRAQTAAALLSASSSSSAGARVSALDADIDALRAKETQLAEMLVRLWVGSRMR